MYEGRQSGGWHKLLWYIACKSKCDSFFLFSFLCSAEGRWFIFLCVSTLCRLLLTLTKKGQMEVLEVLSVGQGRKMKRRKEMNCPLNLWACYWMLPTWSPTHGPLWSMVGKKKANKWRKQLKWKSITSLLGSHLNQFCITNDNYI